MLMEKKHYGFLFIPYKNNSLAEFLGHILFGYGLMIYENSVITPYDL